MDFWAIFLPLVVLLVVAAGATLDSHRKRVKRATYLRTYPSVDTLRTTIDTDKYRAIKTTGGDTKAARALMRDYPGLNLTEAATLTRSL
jgi:hypothetical protein